MSYACGTGADSGKPSARTGLVFPPGHGCAVVANNTMKTRSDQALVQDLRELIAALDRRKPRIGREGERAIALDAQGKRSAALKRIRELERPPCVQGSPTASQETP